MVPSRAETACVAELVTVSDCDSDSLEDPSTVSVRNCVWVFGERESDSVSVCVSETVSVSVRVSVAVGERVR